MRENSGRITAGLIVIFIGLLLFLNQLGGWFWGFNIFRFWPLIFVFIGIAQLIKQKFTAGLIFLLFGGFFLLQSIFNFNAWAMFWPVIIIVIGLSMLFRNNSYHYYAPSQKGKNDKPSSNASFVSNDSINETIAFWGAEKVVTSENFTGGNINCAFGGFELDLRQAKLAKTGAQLNINCAFGGVEIHVPEGVRIESTGTGFFGGWDSHNFNNRNVDKDAPVLRLNGIAAFGGVEIK